MAKVAHSARCARYANANKQKSSRNGQMTRKYLKDNQLVAILFDKGIGICVMSIGNYS